MSPNSKLKPPLPLPELFILWYSELPVVMGARGPEVSSHTLTQGAAPHFFDSRAEAEEARDQLDVFPYDGDVFLIQSTAEGLSFC